MCDTIIKSFVGKGNTAPDGSFEFIASNGSRTIGRITKVGKTHATVVPQDGGEPKSFSLTMSAQRHR